MPEVGIEPTPRERQDFESCASTSSATPANKPRLRDTSLFINILRKDECVKIRENNQGVTHSHNVIKISKRRNFLGRSRED